MVDDGKGMRWRVWEAIDALCAPRRSCMQNSLFLRCTLDCRDIGLPGHRLTHAPWRGQETDGTNEHFTPQTRKAGVQADAMNLVSTPSVCLCSSFVMSGADVWRVMATGARGQQGGLGPVQGQRGG